MTFMSVHCQHQTDKPDQAYEVCLAWNKLLLELERNTPGYRPPISARMFAYVALGAYEAALPALPDHISMETYLKGYQKTEFPDAAQPFSMAASLNATYAQLLRQFFPTANTTLLNKVEALEARFNQQLLANHSTTFENSVKFGKTVAENVWNYSVSDTFGNNGFLFNYDRNYHPPQCKGCWQPTAPLYMPALAPGWARVRTFIVPLNAVNWSPPIPYSETPGSAYYTQAMEVYSVSQPLSKENKWIAEFWSDDLEGFTITPAGRWISIVNQVIEKAQPDISTTLETYLKASMGLCDVAVHCWAIKYRYNIERPQEYIRRVIDPNWSPLHGNPSFPAYPSGHACFGAAVAMVLADVFGDQFTLEDKTHQNRPEFDSAPRTFYSFSDMARENALSRIVGGVHYRMDCEEGLRLGRIIGQKVASITLLKSKLSLQVSKQGL
jgi:hypothetical protein